jgi:formylglycine-generating enzyme required for sulfatase activity
MNANSANYNGCAIWGSPTRHSKGSANGTTVGTNGGPSYYGTYDQSGNLWEWHDLDESVSSIRGRRGGLWPHYGDGGSGQFPTSGQSSISFVCSACRSEGSTEEESNIFGFRIASLTNELSLPYFVFVSGFNDPDTIINIDGTTGYGRVLYSYYIRQYPITNCDYVNFLNAVDPDGKNPENIYNMLSETNVRGGIILEQEAPSGGKYGVKPTPAPSPMILDFYYDTGKINNEMNYWMKDKPVNFVSWFDCARYCNWVHNGMEKFITTDAAYFARNFGAYDLGGKSQGTAVRKNSEALYHIPTENEWYKAAYYNGNKYWKYATQSDIPPGRNFGLYSQSGDGPFPTEYVCG